MSDFRDNIISHRPMGRYFTIGSKRLRGQAGTYNGTTCNASTLPVTNISDRWEAQELTDAVNDAVLTNMIVPNYYKSGTNIDVVVAWSTLASTSGNAYYDVGFAASGAGDTLTTVGSMTFKGLTTYAGPTTTNQLIINTFTFSGTNVQPGDILTAVVYRVGGNASDTINTAMHVISISFDFKVNAKGNLTI